jgi:hypothetical protein
MFGRKKREKARELADQQIAAQRVKLQRTYDEYIQTACQIKDPAEKILALKKIEDSLKSQIYSEQRDISNKAERQSKKIDTIGSLISTGGGVAALSLLGGPVAWVGIPIIFAGGAGAEYLAGKREKALAKKFTAAANDYLKNLKEMSGLVSEITKVTVENNVQEISHSPLYKKMLELPGLTDLYAAAAAKHIETDKESAVQKDDGKSIVEKPDAKTQPGEKPVTPPRKRRPPNYDELKGL